MDTNKILQSDYLDLLYDGRNKKYGSYELRRNYEKRMRAAILVLMAASGIFSGYSVIANNATKAVVTNHLIMDSTVLADIKPPVVLPPPPPQPPLVRPTIAFTPPRIVRDDSVTERPPEVDTLAKLNVGLHTVEGDTDTESKIRTGVVTSTTKKNEIPMWVEQMPEAPYDVNAYLGKNIQYPANARENNIEGRVAIQFVVSKDGSISDVKVAGNRRLRGGLEEEAMRIVSSMPKWKPGKQNGKPVKVYYTLPVVFRLE